MNLSEINIYPVKSLAGISLKEAKIERRGLEFDRRWMLVDENNNSPYAIFEKIVN